MGSGVVVVDYLMDPFPHQQQFQHFLVSNFWSCPPSVHPIGGGMPLLPPSDAQSLVVVVTKESFVVHVIHDIV